MAATGTPTPNIGLRIPLGTDPASVDDINYNSNLIDTKLGAVGNDSVQDQIDDLNSNKQNKLLSTSFTGTTDSSGNIVLKDSLGNTIDQNHGILAVATSIGYCTNPVPDSGGWIVKVLTGSGSAVAARVSTQGTFYITYT